MVTPRSPQPPDAPNPDTRQTREEQHEPRLPHEHDESADSQPMPMPPNGEPIERAARDVERGLVDTDEGRRAHAVEKPR